MAKVAPSDGMDAEYLKSTIGEALSQGCAATALAHPPDPVDFLSCWLLQHAKNKHIRAGLVEEKREELERERIEREQFEMKEAARREKEDVRKMALERVAGISDDAWLMWTSALEEAQRHTGMSAAYVAVLEEGSPAPEPTEDGEEPEEETPEEEDLEEEETEEDGPDAWYRVPEENPNPEKPSEEPGEEEPSEEEKEEEKEEGEGGEEKPTGPDYKSTQLWYTVVRGGDEGAVLGKKLTRTQGGVSFEVLDQRLPTLHVPNVLYKRGVHFFGRMPRLGALFVAAIPPISPEKTVEALLCADSLRTDGNGTGRPFSDEDQAFLTALAAAMARATAEGEGKNTGVAEKVKAQVDLLKAAVYRAQKEAEAAAAQAEEDEEKEADEENEDAEAPTSDTPASTPLTRAAAALSQTRATHAAAVTALDAVREEELARLKRVAKCSPMVLKVPQAAAMVIGRNGTQEWPDWSKARGGLNAEFIQACQQHDPTLGATQWAAVRKLLKDIDAKALLGESPLAYVLYRWILSCKSVEVAHLAHRKAQEEADAAAAEKAREEAEAAEAAAAAAAEAKEEGEEDEEEEGDDEDEVDELANLGDADRDPGRTRSGTVL